jgi:hypothetical protein
MDANNSLQKIASFLQNYVISRKDLINILVYVRRMVIHACVGGHGQLGL